MFACTFGIPCWGVLCAVRQFAEGHPKGWTVTAASALLPSSQDYAVSTFMPPVLVSCHRYWSRTAMSAPVLQILDLPPPLQMIPAIPACCHHDRPATPMSAPCFWLRPATTATELWLAPLAFSTCNCCTGFSPTLSTFCCQSPPSYTFLTLFLFPFFLIPSLTIFFLY